MRVHYWGRVVCALAFCLVSSLWSRPARTQPSADAVYQDVKAVIEQLVTREIAQSVTPRLACYSPDGLLKYYPDTLQLIYERNLGAVKQAFRDETIELFANYAFVSLERRRPVDLGEFLPVKNLGKCGPDVGCCREVREAGGPARYAERLAAELNASLPPGRSAGGAGRPLDVCATLDEAKAPSTALNCHLVRAIAESARGDDATAQELLARAVSVLVYRGMFTNPSLPPGTLPSLALLDERRSKLFEQLVAHVRARLLSGATTVSPELRALAAVDMDQVKLLLGRSWSEFIDGRNLRFGAAHAEARAVTGAIRLYWSLLERIDDPAAPPWATLVLRQHAGNERTVDLGQLMAKLDPASLQPLPGETPAAVLARVLLAEAGEGPASQIRVTHVAGRLRLEWTQAAAAGGVPLVSGDALGVLAELWQSSKLAAKLESLLLSGAASGKTGDTLLDKLAPLVVIKGLALIERIGAEWDKLEAAGGGKVKAPALIAALLRSGGAGLRMCLERPEPAAPAAANAPGDVDPERIWPVMAPTWCDAIDQLKVFTRSDDLHRMLLALTRQNYKDAAVYALTAMFSVGAREQVCCGWANQDECLEEMEIYGRFAVSFATYLLSNPNDADGALAARAAFKEAAYEVLSRERTYSGFDWPWGWRIIVPTASLRVSWSNGYVNYDRVGIRYVATLEFLNALIPLKRTQSTFLGLQVSAVDGIGPFSEIALRDPNVIYENPGLVFANFLNPRVELMVASPALSKRLALSLGGSLRTAMPFEVIGRPGVREYSTWFARSSSAVEDDAGIRFMSAVEASLAIKYMP